MFRLKIKFNLPHHLACSQIWNIYCSWNNEFRFPSVTIFLCRIVKSRRINSFKTCITEINFVSNKVISKIISKPISNLLNHIAHVTSTKQGTCCISRCTLLQIKIGPFYPGILNIKILGSYALVNIILLLLAHKFNKSVR